MPASRRLFSLKQRPTTFAEAGVVAPFTTPQLAQARLRPDYRGRIEVVARNPTGADGMYVLPLAALGELFRLSVHDRALAERLHGLAPISPVTIREVALTLAAEGLAGPDAKDAADRGLAEAEERQLLTMLLLLEQLLQEAGLERIDWKSIDTSSKDARERLRPYFKSLEPSLRMSAADLIAAIDELSGLLSVIGHVRSPYKSYADGTLEEVRGLHKSIGSWARGERDDHAAIARLVLECAVLTVECAEPSLAKAKEIAQDARRLIMARRQDPARIDELLIRPLWLLDGWRHLAALWRAAADQPRDVQRDSLVELGDLAPLVPLVADEWAGRTLEVKGSTEMRRWVRLNEDWRTGHVVDRQGVVEQLLAEAL